MAEESTSQYPYGFIDREGDRIKPGWYVNEYNKLFRVIGFLYIQKDELWFVEPESPSLILAKSEILGRPTGFHLDEKGVRDFKRVPNPQNHIQRIEENIQWAKSELESRKISGSQGLEQKTASAQSSPSQLETQTAAQRTIDNTMQAFGEKALRGIGG